MSIKLRLVSRSLDKRYQITLLLFLELLLNSLLYPIPLCILHVLVSSDIVDYSHNPRDIAFRIELWDSDGFHPTLPLKPISVAPRTSCSPLRKCSRFVLKKSSPCLSAYVHIICMYEVSPIDVLEWGSRMASNFEEFFVAKSEILAELLELCPSRIEGTWCYLFSIKDINPDGRSSAAVSDVE